jgi:diguanylate cyclase (GGDEF)-like protein
MTAMPAPAFIAALGLGAGIALASLLPWIKAKMRPNAAAPSVAARVEAKTEAATWLELAASAAHFGTWRMAPDRRMTWSAQIFQIHGLGPADPIPNSQEALDFFVPEDRAAISTALTEAWKTGASFELAARLRRPDTELRHVVLRGRRLGEAMLGVLLDVTDERRVEAQMREARQLALQANAALREMTTEDDETGLANRRQFDRSLVHEFKRALRSGTPLGLVLIELDQSKFCGETPGQPASGDALRQVAQTIKAVPRRTGDLVARYSELVIAVLLPLADESGTERVATIILEAVRALRIAHSASETGCLTVSCGSGAFVGLQGMNNPLELVTRADQALAVAKASGGDRVRRYDPGINADLINPYGAPEAELERFIKSRS